MVHISEERREANRMSEQEAEKVLSYWQSQLRKKASNNTFAWECWEYYKKNYIGAAFKSATFSVNYLKETLDYINAHE